MAIAVKTDSHITINPPKTELEEAIERGLCARYVFDNGGWYGDYEDDGFVYCFIYPELYDFENDTNCDDEREPGIVYVYNDNRVELSLEDGIQRLYEIEAEDEIDPNIALCLALLYYEEGRKVDGYNIRFLAGT